MWGKGNPWAQRLPYILLNDWLHIHADWLHLKFIFFLLSCLSLHALPCLRSAHGNPRGRFHTGGQDSCPKVSPDTRGCMPG